MLKYPLQGRGRAILFLHNEVVYEQNTSEQNPEYLALVRDYADTLLDHARDTYGSQHSPLIASALNRTTLKLPQGNTLAQLLAIPRKTWGIRSHDR